MRNMKRTIAIALVLILALAQVAFAADVTTVNGTWLGKTSVSLGGMDITKIRVKLQDGQVLVQVGKGNTMVKNGRGTYTVVGDKIKFNMASTNFATLLGDMSYEIKAATKTKAERLVLSGPIMGLTMKQNFDREAIKVTSSSYTKVKRNAETKLKIKTTANADFVILCDKDGVELGRSETKSASNVFTVPYAFAKKSNTVYAYAGMYDVDGKVQTKDLSAKKKIVVACK